MGFTDLVTPITSSHGHDRKLGEDDRSANGGGDLAEVKKDKNRLKTI